MQRSLTAILVLAALAFTAGCALSEEESGEETIGPGVIRLFDLDFLEGSTLRVEYEIEVVTGPKVDVYFAPRAGYDELMGFDSTLSTFYDDWSHLDTSHAREVFRLREHDTYFLIIMNTDEEQEVTFKYTLTYGPDNTLAYALLSIFTVTLVGLPILIYFLYYRKRSRTAMPPPRPFGTGRMPDGPPPAPPPEARRSDQDTLEHPHRNGERE